MFELIDIRPAVKVQEAEYKRLLGLPPHYEFNDRTRELADAAAQWYAEHGRPWIYARQTNDIELANGNLKLGGSEFSSQQLHNQFASANVSTAVLVAVSAGKECEAHARELWQESKPDEYFFLEMFGSAVVENLITLASGRICGWADTNGMVALPHYSPGYSGWDVSDQVKLWELFREQNDRALPGDLHVMDAGMLRPKKSLLAVIGITADVKRARQFVKLVPCENCALPACQYRRAPYKHSRPPIEDVHRLQAAPASANGKSNRASPLTPDAKYSVNIRALRKWSRERLALKTLSDGSLEAEFRYDGTTCANMGQPLQFLYHIKLSSPTDGYRILEANCAPAPDDTGHTQQCEYLNDAIGLMGSIANEKPLLGQPLNDVLTWERPSNPSGCYCDIERRMHKWGLVFEVIHHALVQN
ncbi:MAG TPA: hypothetical protein VFZ59_17225 [Verrucomicrobiae bacterium]|nr:hypothetical protein [Verrucomicrobiae bacterium]